MLTNFLQFFSETNTTESKDLTPEMKVFYSNYMIDNAKPKLVHDQFGQKQPIPKNGGKIIEFRKFDPLPKSCGTLIEGVTPKGSKLVVTTVLSEVHQYGDYIEVSDILQLTAIDNALAQATKLLGAQAGETLDTITREVLNGGTNVQYAEGQVTSRAQLNGGQASAKSNHYLTVKAIKMAVRSLKNQNATPIGDSFVAIIHPDVAFDLTNDPMWVAVKEYSDPKDIYEGEIGKLFNVRFVETTEAKIFKAKNFTAEASQLTTAGSVSNSDLITVAEAITDDEAKAIGGRKVIISGVTYTVLHCFAGEAGYAKLRLDKSITDGGSTPVTSVGGGVGGRAVYSTLVFGENAYGTTEIEGGGLEHIFKPLGSAGAADPLNQRATAGWKATKTAERLVEPFMVRIETCSEFDSPAN